CCRQNEIRAREISKRRQRKGEKGETDRQPAGEPAMKPHGISGVRHLGSPRRHGESLRRRVTLSRAIPKCPPIGSGKSMRNRTNPYIECVYERGHGTGTLLVGRERSADARVSRHRVGSAGLRQPRSLGKTDARRLPGRPFLVDHPAEARRAPQSLRE